MYIPCWVGAARVSGWAGAARVAGRAGAARVGTGWVTRKESCIVWVSLVFIDVLNETCVSQELACVITIVVKKIRYYYCVPKNIDCGLCIYYTTSACI